MKCMIIEDEFLALKQMESYVQQTPFLSLCGSASNAQEALEMYHQIQPDLLFVDINLPDLNGMEFVKSLNDSCLVIFTTAYSEYAIDSYKVDAVDYLLKPISYIDFLKSTHKARKRHENASATNKSNQEKHLFIKSGYRLVRINLANIKYIEGMREYVRIHLAEGNTLTCLKSMKSLEEILPANKFIRIHRSYIVNIEQVESIERQRIIFDKNIYIPVGEQYKEKWEEFIEKYSL